MSDIFNFRIKEKNTNSIKVQVDIVHPDVSEIPDTKSFALFLLTDLYEKLDKGYIFNESVSKSIIEDTLYNSNSKHKLHLYETIQQGNKIIVTEEEYNNMDSLIHSDPRFKGANSWGLNDEDYYVQGAGDDTLFMYAAEKEIKSCTLSNTKNYPKEEEYDWDEESGISEDDYYDQFYSIIPQGDLLIEVNDPVLLDCIPEGVIWESAIYNLGYFEEDPETYETLLQEKLATLPIINEPKFKLISPKLPYLGPILEYSYHRKFIGKIIPFKNKEIISTSEDGNVYRYNYLAKSFRPIAENQEPVNDLVLTPDKKILIGASDNQNVIIWDTDTWEIVQELKGHTDYVSRVALTHDKIISASKDSTIKIWDINSYELLHTLEGHNSWITGLEVSLDGTTLISSASDRYMLVWDLIEMKIKVDVSGESSDTYSLEDYSDTSHPILEGLYIGGKNTSGIGHESVPKSMKWLNNGSVVSVAENIIVWDENYKEQKRIESNNGDINELIIHNDLFITVAYDIVVRRGDEIIGKIQGHDDEINSVALTDDHQYLITGDKKGKIKLWDFAELCSGKYAGINGHYSNIWHSLYNTDHQELYTTCTDCAIIKWNVNTGLPIDKKETYKFNELRLIGEFNKQLVIGIKNEFFLLDPHDLSIKNKIEYTENDMFSTSEAIELRHGVFLCITQCYKSCVLDLHRNEVRTIDTLVGSTDYMIENEGFVFTTSYVGEVFNSSNRGQEKKSEDINYSTYSPAQLMREVKKRGLQPSEDCDRMIRLLENDDNGVFEFPYEKYAPVVVFNKADENEVRYFDLPEELRDLDNKIYPNRLCFNTDKTIVYALFNKEGIVCGWDIETGKVVHSTQGIIHNYSIYMFFNEGHIYIGDAKDKLTVVLSEQLEVVNTLEGCIQDIKSFEKGGSTLMVKDNVLHEVKSDTFESLSISAVHIRVEGDKLIAFNKKDVKIYQYNQ